MFILLRLVRTLVVLALVVVALGVVALVAGRPMLERLAARSIEDRLGTPVNVSIDTSIGPGIARGDLGTVIVRARQFERDGLKLLGAQAVYRGVGVDLSSLTSGNVRLHYTSVGFQGTLTEAALSAYLRPLLAARGLPAGGLRVAIDKGRATLRMGSLHAAVSAAIVGMSAIRLIPLTGSPVLTRAFATPIALGPLPDGVRLTAIALRGGQATLFGRGGAGNLRA